MEPKLTDRAKRVLALAGEFAAECGHPFVGTEHLLVALVREGKGVAAEVLRSLGVYSVVEPEVKVLMANAINVPTAEVK